MCYSDSAQNQEVLQWMKSWPKTTSMYQLLCHVMIKISQRDYIMEDCTPAHFYLHIFNE